MTRGADAAPGRTLTLSEVAERLGVHYMTAYRYVRTGQLIATRIGGRWRVAPSDLAAFERDRSIPPARGRRRARDDGAVDQGGAGRRPYRARLPERMLAGDETGAWLVIESALVAGMRPDRVHLDLLAPCLGEVGDRWVAGSVSVGGEHVASAVAVRLVARLAPLSARRGRTRGALVIGGPAGELHGLPISIVSNVLRSRGWEVVELGPNTPAADVLEAVGHTDRLRAVGISVGSSAAEGSAARTLAAVHDRFPGVPLLAGGPGVPDARAARLLGAEGWARDADELDVLLSSATGVDHAPR
jgi:MerR family transcriptional regulator, light-induced transcriptional regulator